MVLKICGDVTGFCGPFGFSQRVLHASLPELAAETKRLLLLTLRLAASQRHFCDVSAPSAEPRRPPAVQPGRSRRRTKLPPTATQRALTWQGRGYLRHHRWLRAHCHLRQLVGWPPAEATDDAADARRAWARAGIVVLVIEQGLHHQGSALRNAHHDARRRGSWARAVREHGRIFDYAR